jgi:MFS family permease
MATGRSTAVKMAIFVSYFIQVMMLQGPATVLPYIADDLNFTSVTSAQISAAGTAAVATSKMVSGPAVDLMGGRSAMLTSIVSVSALCAVFGFSSSPVFVGMIFAGINFFNAPLWPAEGLVMKENFPPGELAGLYRLMSISSRLAAFVVMASYSGLLNVMDWRWLSRVTASLGLVGISVTVFLVPKLQNTTTTTQSTEAESSASCNDASLLPVAQTTTVLEERKPLPFFSRVKLLLQQPWYRWALLANAGTTGVTGMTFIISTFFADTLPEGDFQVLLSSAAFPAGLLVCLLVPGYYYKQIAHHNIRSKQILCQSLQIVSLICTMCLTFASSPTTTQAGIAVKALLVFGVTFGLGKHQYGMHSVGIL